LPQRVTLFAVGEVGVTFRFNRKNGIWEPTRLGVAGRASCPTLFILGGVRGKRHARRLRSPSQLPFSGCHTYSAVSNSCTSTLMIA
jgi:hypothetical protein